VFILQGKDASKLAGNWLQLLMALFTKEYLPTSVVERKIVGSIEVTERRRRKRKQLLDDVWETRGCRNLQTSVAEGKIEGSIEVTGRQRRKRKQPTFLPQCERPIFTPIRNNNTKRNNKSGLYRR